LSIDLTALSLHSEPYAPTGNIGDSGFRKLLGTPSMDILQTVIREAVQNSCDADKNGVGPRIKIRLRTLNSEQVETLKSCCFAELPECPESRTPLTDFLSSPSPVVLEICDFNTTGLGGPTRADLIPPGSNTTDFIDFLRNVGTTRDTNLGGGTYGFGKVSLYLAGYCSSILVDTQADANGGGERRLMGCHLGPAFSRSRPDGSHERFTGRHWWGVPDSTNQLVEPLRGEGARQIAERIGLPLRTDDDSGTSILIPAPRLADESLEDAARRTIEGLLWNFWPRMMKSTPPSKRIQFEVEADRKQITVPEPENHPPLDLFCRAMDHIRNASDEMETIRSQRPKQDLGSLSISKGVRASRIPLVSDDSAIPRRAHHIAVMRPVELVVKYFEGDPLPDERMEWAGVFVASSKPEVEKAFADSEPPAHDDWIPDMLPKGYPQTWVRVGIREIKRAAKEVAAPGNPHVSGSSTEVSLASVAGRMGALLGASVGDGAGPIRSSRSKGSAPRKRRISAPEFVALDIKDQQRIAVFEADLSGMGPDVAIEAEPVLAVEGGAMAASVSDTNRTPQVLGISLPGTGLETTDSILNVGKENGTLRIIVSVPDDCAVGLKLALREGAQ